jgi:hypothetical protein
MKQDYEIQVTMDMTVPDEDEQLKALNFTDEEIKTLKSGGVVDKTQDTEIIALKKVHLFPDARLTFKLGDNDAQP